MGNRNIKNKSNDFQVAQQLIRKLRLSQGKRNFILNHLEKLYQSFDETIRYYIIIEMIKTRDKNILDFLGKILLKDESELIRHEAAFGIGIIGNKRFQGLLIKAILKDPAPIVRHEAAVALADIGDYRSLKVLKTVINKVNEDKVVMASAKYSFSTINRKSRS